MTNYSRSVLKSNGPHRSKNLPVKFGFSSKTVSANTAQKLPLQRCFKPFLIPLFNFSHKWHTFDFVGKSGYTLAFAQRIAHSGSHGETGAFPPSSTVRLCAACEIATERTAGESGCTPYGVCPLSPASRPRWAAQSGRCCFRSRERFSLAVFVLTVSSPAPAAVPVPLGAAVRSRGDSCRSAVDSIPPSSAAEHPAPPR